MPHLRGSGQRQPPAITLQDLSASDPVQHTASWVCGGMRAISDYFKRADVQKAIHVGRTTNWVPNDDAIVWHHPKAGISFLGEVKRLAQQYPFLVYSGDADAQIPHTSTEVRTSAPGLPNLRKRPTILVLLRYSTSRRSEVLY